jgi:hypothetical protein
LRRAAFLSGKAALAGVRYSAAFVKTVNPLVVIVDHADGNAG